MYYLISIAYKNKPPKKVVSEDIDEIKSILLDVNSELVGIQVELIEK